MKPDSFEKYIVDMAAKVPTLDGKLSRPAARDVGPMRRWCPCLLEDGSVDDDRIGEETPAISFRLRRKNAASGWTLSESRDAEPLCRAHAALNAWPSSIKPRAWPTGISWEQSLPAELRLMVLEEYAAEETLTPDAAAVVAEVIFELTSDMATHLRMQPLAAAIVDLGTLRQACWLFDQAPDVYIPACLAGSFAITVPMDYPDIADKGRTSGWGEMAMRNGTFGSMIMSADMTQLVRLLERIDAVVPALSARARRELILVFKYDVILEAVMWLSIAEVSDAILGDGLLTRQLSPMFTCIDAMRSVSRCEIRFAPRDRVAHRRTLRPTVESMRLAVSRAIGSLVGEGDGGKATRASHLARA